MSKPSDDSQKARLRKSVRAQRAEQVGDTARQEALEGELRTLLAGHQSVIAYAALSGEPNLDAALDAALAAGTSVFLPSAGALGTALRFGRITGGMAALEPQGAWGIREPAPEFSAAEVLAGSAGPAPTLALIPGLAYSAAGARLGNGGGYYDRTFGPQGQAPLADLPEVRVVGVCFAAEFGLPLTAQPHDLIVEAVLTDGGLREV